MDDHDDDDLRQLLTAAGAREPLPAEMKARWEAHVRAELNAVRNQRMRRRTLALCAGIAVITVALLLSWQTPVERPTADYRLVHLSGDVRTQQNVRLVPGMALPPGTELSTGNAAFVTLSYQGHELRLRESSRLLLAADHLYLHLGMLYAADTPETLPGATALLIRTDHGSVRDIGTQFTVAIVADSTQATVREGSIQVSAEGSEQLLVSRSGQAQRSVLRSGAPIEVAAAASRGDAWDWIYRAGAPYELDGKSALDFLQWAARESGRELRFQTPDARRRAEQTVLRGNPLTVDPDTVVEPILATTDLRADIRDHELMVHAVGLE